MERNKKCNCEKEDKKWSKSIKPPHQKPKPPCLPEKNFPEQRCDKEIVCENICGNLNLDQDVQELVIWQKILNTEAVVTISVFNSAFSMVDLQVIVQRMIGIPFEFKVPKGNTISATIENVRSITVVNTEEGKIEGKFCLEICFPFS